MLGCVPVNIIGGKRVAGVEIGQLGAGDKVEDSRKVIGCDVVGLSGGYSRLSICCHIAALNPFGMSACRHSQRKNNRKIHTIGAADGFYDDEPVLLSAKKVVGCSQATIYGRLHEDGRLYSSLLKFVQNAN